MEEAGTEISASILFLESQGSLVSLSELKLLHGHTRDSSEVHSQGPILREFCFGFAPLYLSMNHRLTHSRHKELWELKR